jgi:hypothetical protein
MSKAQHVSTTNESSSKLKLNSVALVRKRTIPTERQPHIGEISAKLCG